jgi:histidine triad (HIT) family protein
MGEDNCIFCKIIAGEMYCSKIFEDENYLAFLDIAQFTKGHTLVIPKKHYRFVWDVEDIRGYFEVVQKISQHYQRDLGYQYVDSLCFGRMVPHAHVHLLPHNGDDKNWNNALKELEYLSSLKPKLTSETDKLLINEFKL